MLKVSKKLLKKMEKSISDEKICVEQKENLGCRDCTAAASNYCGTCTNQVQNG